MECQIRESEQGIEISEEYRNLVSFLRSRLDVISTSLYLLEGSCREENIQAIKYLKKINDEMESIRKFINM
ncbi:MAG: hypothetical protein KAJ16_03610 [Calditrichia bacterium]|nr:hypothetical protein [Calditrichia bacterium]